MIIVMTNRKLQGINDDQQKKLAISDIANVLAEGGGKQSSLRTGIVLNNNEIEFYQKDKDSSVFQKIPEADQNKPWVFFVHGFNQTMKSSLTKAQQLSQHHQVNVIMFAWPSKPITIISDNNDMYIELLRSALTGTFASDILKQFLMSKVKNFVKEKWVNYPPAIKNAEKSVLDFEKAINLIDILPEKPVLLVHSMGNYLLENFVKNKGNITTIFKNIILHQADVNAEDHEWVKSLKSTLNTNGRLYITINAPDYVLAASSVRRKILRQHPTERLGQTRQHYIVDDKLHYIDCTDGEGIGDGHEFFKFSRNSTNINTHYFDWFQQVFHQDKDQLPQQNMETSAGFSKMPTPHNLYQFEEILDPVNGEYNDNYEKELIKSLDWFENPSSPKVPIEDEELLDDEYDN